MMMMKTTAKAEWYSEVNAGLLLEMKRICPLIIAYHYLTSLEIEGTKAWSS
jgi:hypothetical protein